LTGSEDPYLLVLTELVLTSDRDKRELYPLLEEPVFYRKYIRRWILEGMEEVKKLK
jgi:hypothetical protein